MSRHNRGTGLVALALGYMLTCAVGCSGKGDKDNGQPQDTRPKPGSSLDIGPGKTPPVTPAKFTAEQLTKEFMTDEAKAEKAYDGKIVEVEGLVDGTNQLVMSKTRKVDLRGCDVPGSPIPRVVDCQFEENSTDYEKAKRVYKKQTVQIRGKVSSSGPYGVRLDGCTFVRIDPDPAIPVTAEALAAEFVKDHAAADKKYKDKLVLVKGVTTTAIDPKETTDFLFEKAAGADKKAPPVRANLYILNHERYPKFNKGQTVTVRGTCAGVDFGGEIRIDLAEPIE